MTRVAAFASWPALTVRALVPGTVFESIAHPALDARHTLRQDGSDVVASESWHDGPLETQRYEVRMPFPLLVHLALNTTAAERAEIDARADWRGVDEK